MGEHGRAVGGPAGAPSARSTTRIGARRADRVEAGSLAEGELQFVVDAGGVAAGAEGAAVGTVEDERDRGGVDVEENHAGLTETVGGLYPAPAVDGREELLVDRHI